MPDFLQIARTHLARYGAGSWIDRESPILAEKFREMYEAGRSSLNDNKVTK
jgi:hypothetical protein